MTGHSKQKLSINHLLKLANISKSGYYRYLSQHDYRMNQDEQDAEDFKWIKAAYTFKRRHKGAKSIKMTLAGQFDMVMNLKKIRRLMKKYNLICPIRKANPYKRMIKAMQTSNVADNKLQRNFKKGNPNQIFLTDITYLIYDLNKRAYLSGVKDGVTNEIVAHVVSDSLDITFVEQTMDQLEVLLLDPKALINSDQGCHYTSYAFQNKVKELGLEQSMSRRGNCWDNAPIESFFGHMKDEINLIDCKTLQDVKQEIDDYMDYYNNYRYQWNLNRMTPKQYGDRLRNNNKKDGRSKPEQPSINQLIKY
jgi:putative transposase